MRGFPSDLTITATALSVLEALEQALQRPHRRVRRTATGTAGVTVAPNCTRDWRDEAERAGRGNKNTLRLAEPLPARRGRSRTRSWSVEYSFRQEYCPLDTPGSLFGVSAAGGLGWGFGASLGAKLAAPQRQVLSVLGDGAYMFANPTACHYMAQMQNLPVLTVIYNNALYGAVRRATLDMYRQWRRGARTTAACSPTFRRRTFEKIVAAHDGHGERVERPADLPAALRRAADAVRGGQQALVNVICPP